MTQLVSPLKKVTVTTRVLTEAGRQVHRQPVSFSYIHGVSSSGMLPFEIEVGHLSTGEKKKFTCVQDELYGIFGYLLPLLKQSLDKMVLPEKMILEFSIEKVEESSQREVVAAISASVGGGCGGDCGCGCC